MVMFSGNPSVAQKIMGKVNAGLIDHPKETVTNMMDAFTHAYQNEFKEHVENHLLSPYGMTREKFFLQGRTVFGESEFQRIVDRIEETGLTTDLLVVGFEQGGLARIFSVRDPGVCTLHDAQHFNAIGCGAPLADAMLMHTFDVFDSLPIALYRLIEAKLRSEKAPGVGKRTYVTILSPDGTLQEIGTKKIESLREQFEAESNRPVPAQITDSITKAITPEK